MSSLFSTEIILNISLKYNIYVSLLIAIIGLIGNSLNIIVFTNLKLFRKNQCIFYLIIEAIANIGQLIILLSLRILLVLYGSDLSQYSFIWCKFRSMVIQIFLLPSILTVCCMTFDQFLSTSYLFYLRQISTLKLARHLIFGSICFSLFHSILLGLLFDYKPLITCAIFNPALNRYISYFFYPVLCGFLPISITISCSLLAYRNVRRITRRQLNVVRRRLDRQLTAMVLIRVWFFILFKTTFVVYRIYAINTTIDPTDSMRLAIERLILTIISSLLNLDYAINFSIFFASSSQYRRQVKYVLIKKVWQRCKRWFRSEQNQIDPAIELRPTHSIEFD
ncbi:unnamed protein product [Rotaria sp. Silwood1]|nr:unnamed protein product [Rotaria sp. Silwood1]CAF1610841.1 unnamed protein product [Rotaria sp. Silwood1]CAF3599461.1 unnamed protein product [Rotaria sp. Silwood1]CAF3779574.1 unnamed protein product [Rotaria sp. Silwood1]CAF3837834.1 unnamed protein product [Rotaria sp. Silwood1]